MNLAWYPAACTLLDITTLSVTLHASHTNASSLQSGIVTYKKAMCACSQELQDTSIIFVPSHYVKQACQALQRQPKHQQAACYLILSWHCVRAQPYRMQGASA